MSRGKTALLPRRFLKNTFHVFLRTTINAQGQIIGQICRGFGISPTTYYRWRKEYGGLKVIQAKRLKELEKENARLRKVVSDLSLNDGSCVRLRPSHRNQVWSYDS